MDLRTLTESMATPKHAPADSFILHAPLELLARITLLPRVRHEARADAHLRLSWLGERYEAAGEPVAARPAVAFDCALAAAERLVAALAAGELDDVDDAAVALGTMASATELRDLLASDVITSLAAAGHASIFFNLLPRVSAASVTGTLLRGPVRDLARNPTWRLHWFDDPDDATAGGSLAHALLEVPMLGPAGNNFIHPMMNQAEASGIAPKLLSGIIDAAATDLAQVTRQLSRVAAWSMVQEGPASSAYGWSHCLTMPQAVMGVAAHVRDARIAVAVASTYVVGFRAAIGKHTLDPQFVAPAPSTDQSFAEALASSPDAAASYAWHAPAENRSALEAELATRAARHHDAHFAKYTLACFDAADADPTYKHLYLAAAAYLAAFWDQRGDDQFFD